MGPQVTYFWFSRILLHFLAHLCDTEVAFRFFLT